MAEGETNNEAEKSAEDNFLTKKEKKR